jgi:hypothetical protein
MRMFLFCPKDPATKPGYSVKRICGPTKVITIDAKVVKITCYTVLQMAEVAKTQELIIAILRRIQRLRLLDEAFG